ncbi:hypothetical protein PG997_001818 [Apiospora hydei]|uniref:Uncharacterized protein n=1 Tax=Apiospora hydei TaxID=1337664 RepID=A0ABR1X7M1_9PEZI
MEKPRYGQAHPTIILIFSLKILAFRWTSYPRIRLYGEPKASEIARQIINKPALGVVWEQKTCVEVRWPFLAFPTTLVALTTMFLVVIIVQSARDTGTTNSWKSSLLPMVFHGFSMNGHYWGDVDGDVGLGNLRDMERVAKKTTAKLHLVRN